MKIKIQGFKTINSEIQMDFENHNIISIIGENGSGKTNILDAIYHFFHSGDKEIYKPKCNHGDNIKEEKTRISYEIEINDTDLMTIKSIFQEYNIDLPCRKILKHFSKDETTLFRRISKGTDIFDISNKIYEKELINYEKKYPKLMIINKSELGLYSININKNEIISQISEEDSIKILKLHESLENIYSIFMKHKSKYYYSKNAADENDIKFSYDLSTYENDNTTREIINFFSDKTDEYIKVFLDNNDGTSSSQSKISATKKKWISDAKGKIDSIFKDLNIYAMPEIDIDGQNFKILVKIKNEKISINDNVETNNNSSGYKSIFWLIIHLEIAISTSKSNESEYIVLADEPDKNIHPLLQQQFIKYVSNKIKNTKVKFIFTTHSPFLLLNEIKKYIISRDSIGNTYIKNATDIENGDIIPYYPLILNKQLSHSKSISNLSERRPIFIDSKNKDDIPEVKKFIDLICGYKVERIFLLNKNDNDAKDFLKSLDKPKNSKEFKKIFSEFKPILISNDFIEEAKNKRKKNTIN